MKIDGALPRAWPTATALPRTDIAPQGVPETQWHTPAPRAPRLRPPALHHRELQNFPAATGANPYLSWPDSRLAAELSEHFPALEKRYGH